MLPNNNYTYPNAIDTDFLYPENRKLMLWESYEKGGVAIKDNSEGLNSYDWYCWTDGQNILLKRMDLDDTTTLLTGTDITEVDFTFDQNMNPNCVYVDNTITKLWYYSTWNRKQESKEFPNCFSPRLSLDDKRHFNLPNSDIIFGYINQDNNLCIRLQRERYLDEHVLHEYDVYPKRYLWKIGMGKDLQFLFQVR